MEISPPGGRKEGTPEMLVSPQQRELVKNKCELTEEEDIVVPDEYTQIGGLLLCLFISHRNF